MDDSDDGLAWNRNRDRRERLWGKPSAAAPAAEPPLPSLGDRVAARQARQLEREARAGRRTILPTPRAPGPQQLEDDATHAEHPRPRTRGDCAGGPRPCPWSGCRHHVYLDVSPDTGSIKINIDRDVSDLEHSCSLDIADRGEMTLEEVGAVLGVTRERVRQLETMGLQHLRLRRRRLT